jgi:hypothetical protein
MIPNAMATTGPSAGVWSYWKSIDHALARASSYKRADELSELDRDRLTSLLDFLRRGFALPKRNSFQPVDVLRYSEDAQPGYGSLVDMRPQVAAVEEFKEWQKSSKVSFEHKVQRLIDRLESILKKVPTKGLFADDIPLEELTVLRAIVRWLLLQAETAL